MPQHRQTQVTGSGPVITGSTASWSQTGQQPSFSGVRDSLKGSCGTHTCRLCRTWYFAEVAQPQWCPWLRDCWQPPWQFRAVIHWDMHRWCYGGCLCCTWSPRWGSTPVLPTCKTYRVLKSMLLWCPTVPFGPCGFTSRLAMGPH